MVCGKRPALYVGTLRGTMYLYLALFPDVPASPGRDAALSRIPGKKKDTQRQEPRPIHRRRILWAGTQPWLWNPLAPEILMLFLLQHNLAKANSYSRNVNSTTLTIKTFYQYISGALKLADTIDLKIPLRESLGQEAHSNITLDVENWKQAK